MVVHRARSRLVDRWLCPRRHSPVSLHVHRLLRPWLRRFGQPLGQRVFVEPVPLGAVVLALVIAIGALHNAVSLEPQKYLLNGAYTPEWKLLLPIGIGVIYPRLAAKDMLAAAQPEAQPSDDDGGGEADVLGFEGAEVEGGGGLFLGALVRFVGLCHNILQILLEGDASRIVISHSRRTAVARGVCGL